MGNKQTKNDGNLTLADVFCRNLSYITRSNALFDWTCGVIATIILLISVVGMGLMLKKVHFKVEKLELIILTSFVASALIRFLNVLLVSMHSDYEKSYENIDSFIHDDDLYKIIDIVAALVSWCCLTLFIF